MNKQPTQQPASIPPSWSDLRILRAEIGFFTTVYRAAAIHRGLAFARKHPDCPRHVGQVIDEVLLSLERAMEAEGLEPPPGGWRADVCTMEPSRN